VDKSRKKELRAEFDRVFGLRLGREREAQGLSQNELADLAGLHRTQISLLECGKRNAGIDTVVLLAGALKIDPGILLRGTKFVPDMKGDGEISYERSEDR
jgi:transcriptional regulator with XRE-family HTH domain